ncbi:uncharacterized protein CCR75_009736 [Bremia lactucae]|uniref:Transmembrane protein n=1 Tax=Bremia lactucae TaxID=4779 RepID=A0A976IB27_BRELC|nr:hypothetical protein CCR75_009736 [Bremia lactucae]
MEFVVSQPFLVVVQHSHKYPTQGLSLGSVAVDVFFVLSSFLLTWLFIKKSMMLLAKKKDLAGAITLVDYQKRFFSRLSAFCIDGNRAFIMPFAMKKRYYFVKKPEYYELRKVLLFYPGFNQRILDVA